MTWCNHRGWGEPFSSVGDCEWFTEDYNSCLFLFNHHHCVYLWQLYLCSMSGSLPSVSFHEPNTAVPLPVMVPRQQEEERRRRSKEKKERENNLHSLASFCYFPWLQLECMQLSLALFSEYWLQLYCRVATNVCNDDIIISVLIAFSVKTAKEMYSLTILIHSE